jgi:hypothetical protein
VLAVSISMLAVAVSAVAAVASPPLRTAVTDPSLIQGTDNQLAFTRIRAAGATFVRLGVDWLKVAPSGTTQPAGFDASDPQDPAYSWAEIDSQVEQAVAAGLQPILDVNGAPQWAQHGNSQGLGPSNPDPRMLADFATAIATRFSGNIAGLPRVTYWQLWNEPNITPFLMPQFDASHRPVSPLIYRTLVNAFADAVHAVNPANEVIAGALSPFTVNYRTVKSVGPLLFMREMLCMSAGAHPRPTCSTGVHFDIWSHHPYTSGGPLHHANNPDDVSLGDLPKMRALLVAAQNAGHIVSRHAVDFWVTEFSWDTNPPDPHALPIALQARWTAEALYQMWRSGITLVTWWLLQDQPYPASSFQSGLYFGRAPLASARAKPTLTAFRFPFVAYLRGNGVYLWGRTPGGVAGSVVIQRRAGPGGGWSEIATVTADRNGIFTRFLPIHATASDFLRARLVDHSATTLSFSLTEPPDRTINPFGGGG